MMPLKKKQTQKEKLLRITSSKGSKITSSFNETKRNPTFDFSNEMNVYQKLQNVDNYFYLF